MVGSSDVVAGEVTGRLVMDGTALVTGRFVETDGTTTGDAMELGDAVVTGRAEYDGTLDVVKS